MIQPRHGGEMVRVDKLEVGDRVVVPGRKVGVLRDAPTFETVTAVESRVQDCWRVTFASGASRAWCWPQKVERLECAARREGA